MKKSILKKIKHIFSLTIAAISIIMMKITAFAEARSPLDAVREGSLSVVSGYSVAALEYKAVTDDGKEVTESLLGILCTCVSYCGGACMIVGIIMIALAFKEDNPEKKTKATIVTVTGIIFLFFAEVLKKAGIISEYS